MSARFFAIFVYFYTKWISFSKPKCFLHFLYKNDKNFSTYTWSISDKNILCFSEDSPWFMRWDWIIGSNYRTIWIGLIASISYINTYWLRWAEKLYEVNCFCINRYIWLSKRDGGYLFRYYWKNPLKEIKSFLCVKINTRTNHIISAVQPNRSSLLFIIQTIANCKSSHFTEINQNKA